jgi:hypothetical protein
MLFKTYMKPLLMKFFLLIWGMLFVYNFVHLNLFPQVCLPFGHAFLIFFFVNVSGNIEDWTKINRARAEGRLFNNLKWPNDPALVLLVTMTTGCILLFIVYFSVILHLYVVLFLMFWCN